MSGSVVFYRFKAQKEPSTVKFEGTGISVWDLKKEILAENKLGKGADFDFAVYNADTNEGTCLSNRKGTVKCGASVRVGNRYTMHDTSLVYYLYLSVPDIFFVPIHG